MVPAYDRDYGDEDDFNDWVDKQYDDYLDEDDEDDFYLDPEYWEQDDYNYSDEDDEGETGILVPA